MKLSTLLTIAGLIALVAYIGYHVYTDFFLTYANTTVEIRERNGKKEVHPKKVKLAFQGTHTFINRLDESVTITFKNKGLTRKVRGPFPPKRGERGIYVLPAGATETFNPDIDPGLISDNWKYKVKDSSGKKIDPGIRIKK